MALPMPTMGALAWACSLWTLRRMGTRSRWPTTRALQVRLTVQQGEVACWAFALWGLDSKSYRDFTPQPYGTWGSSHISTFHRAMS